MANTGTRQFLPPLPTPLDDDAQTETQRPRQRWKSRQTSDAFRFSIRLPIFHCVNYPAQKSRLGYCFIGTLETESQEQAKATSPDEAALVFGKWPALRCRWNEKAYCRSSGVVDCDRAQRPIEWSHCDNSKATFDDTHVISNRTFRCVY